MVKWVSKCFFRLSLGSYFFLGIFIDNSLFLILSIAEKVQMSELKHGNQSQKTISPKSSQKASFDNLKNKFSITQKRFRPSVSIV